MQKKIKNFLDEFQLELIEKGYGQGLRWSYGKVCRLFGEWADDHSINCVSEEVIRAYSLEKTGRWEAAINLPGNPKNKVQFPVLFRLLYSCGLRVTETLMIRIKDVDLEEGIIRLRVTKGSKERYAVLSESMRALLEEYAGKTFYLLGEDDFIFSNRKGGALRLDWLEDVHTRLLCMAGIPSASAAGSTKRLHDWRHTHAVAAFKQMVERGHDMYVALPVCRLIWAMPASRPPNVTCVLP